MILARVALTDGRLHQTGQRRQDVDRRADTLVVQLSVNEDLTLGDVTGQIGDGMGDVCPILVPRTYLMDEGGRREEVKKG